MRSTFEISDDLFRQAKVEAALRGRKLRELVEEGLRRVLEAPPASRARPKAKRSLHDLMKDCCGLAQDAPADYATNPKHLKGFGR